MYPRSRPEKVLVFGTQVRVAPFSLKNFTNILTLNLTFSNYRLYLYVLPLVKVTKLAKKQGENKKIKIMKQNDSIRQVKVNCSYRYYRPYQ